MHGDRQTKGFKFGANLASKRLKRLVKKIYHSSLIHQCESCHFTGPQFIRGVPEIESKQPLAPRRLHRGACSHSDRYHELVYESLFRIQI